MWRLYPSVSQVESLVVYSLLYTSNKRDRDTPVVCRQEGTHPASPLSLQDTTSNCLTINSKGKYLLEVAYCLPKVSILLLRARTLFWLVLFSCCSMMLVQMVFTRG